MTDEQSTDASRAVQPAQMDNVTDIPTKLMVEEAWAAFVGLNRQIVAAPILLEDDAHMACVNAAHRRFTALYTHWKG